MLRQTQVTPADVYGDAINQLKRKIFEITASEETFDENILANITESRPLVFTAKKQINDTLAIRIMANVEQCEGPICGHLIVCKRWGCFYTGMETRSLDRISSKKCIYPSSGNFTRHQL